MIGSGFGGLATALRAAELGKRVIVLETVGYPGGCASSFTRGGLRYEAGATLFSGLGEAGIFGRWKREHGLPFEVAWPDPIVHFHSPLAEVPVWRDRKRLLSEWQSRLPAHRLELARFYQRQERVADPLWAALADPRALPPFRGREWWHALRWIPASPTFLPSIGRTLNRELTTLGLTSANAFRVFLDALCQITVQCPSQEADAVFALGTLDYFHRDTGHVVDGIGSLASGLVHAIQSLGGAVHFHAQAKSVRQSGQLFEVQTKRSSFLAPQIVANLLPRDALRLLEATSGRESPRLKKTDAALKDAYGAVMLYAVIPAEAVPHAEHHQIVQNPAEPLLEGNHLFASIGDPQVDPSGVAVRTMTVSTHIRLSILRAEPPEARAATVAAIQAKMARGLQQFCPRIWQSRLRDMPGSPRTFQRFTGRSEGAVGGIPKRPGGLTYDPRPLPQLARGFHLVGDSVFPGQSTLATALGGIKLAERLFG